MFRQPTHLPPQSKVAYRIVAPLATHWRAATCEEVECTYYLDGWQLRADSLSEADRHAVDTSGRHYKVLRIAEGETWLVFEAGQPCFRQWMPGQQFIEGHHRVPNNRPEAYLRSAGDWRLYLGSHCRFDRGDQWRDDFAEHQDKLATQKERG